MWRLLSQFAYFQNFSRLSKHVSYWISCLYLTSVAAALLRWHLSSINWIKKNLRGTFVRSKILITEKLMNRALVTPTPDDWMKFILILKSLSTCTLNTFFSAHPHLPHFQPASVPILIQQDGQMYQVNAAEAERAYLCQVSGFMSVV